MKNNLMIGMFLCISVLAGCGRQNTAIMTADSGGITSEADELERQEEEGKPSEEAYIYVYVCGHVKQPGVYQLAENSRICDALSLAGGVSEDGDAEALNQAEHMTDGQTIYVPGIGEYGKENAALAEDGLLDINTATKEEFMTLPGIGESKASAIIQYREEHGMFEGIEELMEIPGIKKGVFDKIKDKIKTS